jgi:quercetin dioxygenase-like cupin family protein
MGLMSTINRRELAAALAVAAASSPAAKGADRMTLGSNSYVFENLAVKTTGENRSRDVFDGLTHLGFQLDLHETELAPGLAPHAPHRHAHEEMVMVREGTLEVMIEGKTAMATPGSVVVVASNEFHGWKNAGKTRAHYFVLAVGRA